MIKNDDKMTGMKISESRHRNEVLNSIAVVFFDSIIGLEVNTEVKKIAKRSKFYKMIEKLANFSIMTRKMSSKWLILKSWLKCSKLSMYTTYAKKAVSHDHKESLGLF